MKPHPDRIPAIYDRLEKNKIKANLIYSSDKDLDVLPYRASKGKVIRYLASKWNIAPTKILVCGDSGNDAEMMERPFKGVVVANHTEEMKRLRNRKEHLLFERGERRGNSGRNPALRVSRDQTGARREGGKRKGEGRRREEEAVRE